MNGRLSLLRTVLLCSGCGGATDETLAKVDTILHNGTIVTMDARLSIASAVAVDGDRIVAVGDETLLDEYVAGATVDLGGKVLMPGFIDSHTHVIGRPRWHIDLSSTTSIDEIKALVRAKAKELGTGEWITGDGWSEDLLTERRRPLRTDLDEAAPQNPVLLTRAGAHSAVANSLALRLAGVDEKTPQPEGGVIEKDQRGRLNGVIRERQDIVSDLVPVASNEELRDSLIGLIERQLSLGITSFTQAVDTIGHYPEWEYVYSQRRGQLPRASIQVLWEGPEAMAAFGRTTGDGDEYLRVGPIKIIVDGGFTGPAAYTKDPYKGETDYRGTLRIDPVELRTTIRELNAAGWQTGIHAIGDAAIELVVQELAMALRETPRVDHRHYLNHFTVMPSAETMKTMAEYGIAITQQPNFTYVLEGRYVQYLDGERLEHNNALRTPMDHGIHVAVSSDMFGGPMVGIYAAVTRKGLSGRVFAPEEALTVTEALQAYTRHGAYLSFEEDVKGSLEPGKFADMIVLDQDILTVDPERILDIEVLQTWLGGTLVYERKATQLVPEE
jgi:predicted amidohydrolase YtcJ